MGAGSDDDDMNDRWAPSRADSRSRSRSRGRGRKKRSLSRSRSRSKEGRGSGKRRGRDDSRERSRSRSRGRGEDKKGEKAKESSKRDRQEKKKEKEKFRPSSMEEEEEEEEEERRQGRGIEPLLAQLPANGMPPGAFPRAMVTESNGEVSCSLEETNRVRALLGLRPLDMEKRESLAEIAMKNMAEKRAQEKKVQELAELEARLDRARRKRLLNEKLAGAKLSDVQGEEEKELLSAADWVKRSRMKDEAKKEEERLLAEKRRRMMDEEDEEEEEEEVEEEESPRGKKDANSKNKGYTSKDLAGMKVTHDMDDFQEGQEVILTLKDTDVLEHDEHGNLVGLTENEEGLELENVNLAEGRRDEERQARAKRARLPAYSGVDDEEFEQPGKKRALLSQYDEEEKLKAARARKGVVITQEGHIEQSATSASPTEEENGPKKTAVTLSLSGPFEEKKALGDYMTQDEVAKFNKPKKLRKKKNLRKKESDLVAELEATAADAEGEGAAGGNREDMTKKRAAAEAKARAEKEAAYKTAIEKRQARDKVVKGTVPVEEDDPDLAASLERARRLVRLKERAHATSSTVAGGADVVGKDVLERLKRADAKVEKDSTDDNNGVVFSSTVEFSSLLQARLEEGQREKMEKAVEAVSTAAAGGIKKKEPRRMEVGEEEEDEDMMVDEEEEEGGRRNGAGSLWKEVGKDGEEEEEKEQIDFLHKQPVVAKGMAATLALLRNTGELTVTERKMGRDKDKQTLYDVGAIGEDSKPAGVTEPTAERFKDLKIEYRDEDGRLLTTKEEFRRLNYKFHGFGSGAKKERKRQKKIEEAAQAARLSGAGWEALGKAQESAGQAFVVLSGSKEIGVGGPPIPPSSGGGGKAASMLSKKGKK